MTKKKEEVKKVKDEVDIALAKIEKQFGKGIIIDLNQDIKELGIKAISTGSLDLDKALGVGGLPRGRIVEIYGGESAGKTTLCLNLVKQVQKNQGRSAYIDAEHALDFEYGEIMGIDWKDKITIVQPDYGEQALEVLGALIESNKMDLIIIDSVASLTPKAEIEGNMEDNHMGIMARMMGQALRKFSAIIHKTNTCVVFVNQLREKMNVRFGSPETTPGGRALKFYASVRLDLRRISTLKQGEDPIGTKVKATVKKNKVARPFQVANFEIYFDAGLCPVADVINMAMQYKIIEKSGAWFFMGEDQIAQGFVKVRKHFQDNPEALEDLKKKVLETMNKQEEK